MTNDFTSSPFTPAQDGWFQVTPLGAFNHPSGVIQQIDSPAVESIVNRFNTEATSPTFPGLLVDFDHFSQDPQHPTAAAGWITKLEARPSGLWAQIRFSDLGQEAIIGGRYRSLSPVWQASDCQKIDSADGKTLRPMRLDRVALTNDPNIKGMAPLTNRAATAPSPTAQIIRAAQSRALAQLFSRPLKAPLATRAAQSRYPQKNNPTPKTQRAAQTRQKTK
jgi:phage I-like protein